MRTTVAAVYDGDYCGGTTNDPTSKVMVCIEKVT